MPNQPAGTPAQPLSTREPGAVISTSPDAQATFPQATPTEPTRPESREIFANDTDNFFPETGEGRIVVRVQTALGSFPVPEAAVIITKNRNGTKEIVNSQLTDRSGKTQEISVPAPPKADSQSPSEELPFSDYSITVQNPMYYTAVTDNVQVFGDELTIFVAELTPLPELINEANTTQTVTIPRQNL